MRPHSECLTGDVLGSQRCDCGAQLRESVARIADAGGFLLYLRQEGRDIGLYAKLPMRTHCRTTGSTRTTPTGRWSSPPTGVTTPPPPRCCGPWGSSRLDLLSNNPDKATQLERLGLDVASRVPTGVHLTDSNARYLATKAGRGAHRLALPAQPR